MCILCTHRPIYRSTYGPTYRASIGRYVDRHSTDMLVDMSTDVLMGAQNTHPVSWQCTKQTKTFHLAKLNLVVPNSQNLTEDHWRGGSSFFIHLRESISFPKSWHYWDKNITSTTLSKWQVEFTGPWIWTTYSFQGKPWLFLRKQHLLWLSLQQPEKKTFNLLKHHLSIIMNLLM